MELPGAWAWAKVGDLGQFINGLAFKPEDWAPDGRPIIRIQNLTRPNAAFNRTSREVDAKFLVQPGDLLVSWSATLDVFIWEGPEAVLNQHIFRVVPNDGVVIPAFLYWGLRLAIQEMAESEHTHGSTMKHINRGPFLNHPFPLPPLNEQRRIVARLEELQGRTRAAKTALDAIRACEDLLVSHYTTGWPQASLGDSIIERAEVAGTCWNKYPQVGLTNEGRITERREPIGPKTAEKCKIVHPGDIVFNPIRLSIGSIARFRGTEAAIVSPEYQVFTTQNLSQELLCRFLRSPRGQSLLEIQTTGSVRYRVYAKTLKSLTMPVAPSEMQVQAEYYFCALNGILQTAELIQDRLVILKRSLLARAFRGELVPQDPNDEPASVLLERIRA